MHRHRLRAAPGLLAALVMPGLVLTASAAEPTAPRQAELLHLLQQDCGSCHGLTLKGGLGPPLLPAALAPLSDDMLTKTILHGRPGTPMPPWAFEIAPTEADWLVRRLRDGLSHAP